MDENQLCVRESDNNRSNITFIIKSVHSDTVKSNKLDLLTADQFPILSHNFHPSIISDQLGRVTHWEHIMFPRAADQINASS